MKWILLLLFTLTNSSFAKEYGKDQIENLNWGGVEVIWIKDDRFPTYNMIVYFADGALGDGNFKGSTSAAMGMLTSGTRRYDQKAIADTLDFFSVNLDTDVNHEYSRLEVSGLTKDIIPTMKKVCHLIQDSAYPPKELEKKIKQIQASLSNVESNHRALADLVFREVSLKGVPYAYPAGGKMKDYKKINSNVLRDRLKELNENVKKRIYITGPSDVLKIEKIISEDCSWNDKAKFVRYVEYKTEKKEANSPNIFLVPVKKANQAQVRIGRFLSKDEIVAGDERHALLSDILAGGFTSLLMDELRTKRGLVYGVGAFSAGQRDYGRAAISTQTRNDKVVELINVVKESVGRLSNKEIPVERFELIKKGLAGSYPFRFEELESYLFQLLLLDHIDLDYKEMYRSADKIASYKLEDIASLSGQVFEWNRQTILVLGEMSLKKELEKIGKVQVLDYKDFL